MSLLSQLPRIKTKREKKRIGRGYGSGKGGHTVGRGSKGDKARGKVKLTFAGTKIKKSWLKRWPLWRGKGRSKGREKPVTISLAQLEKNFASGEKVTLEALIKKGLIKNREKKRGVKILGRGKLKKRLVVMVACSQGAAEEVKKAGGKVVV